MTAAELIAAEEEVVELWRNGEVNSVIHFGGSVDGSYEQWLVDFFHSNIKRSDWVFASHRCHLHALLHGMPLEELKEQILRGKSMFLFMPRFVCSAIVAGTSGIAAGMALAAKLRGTGERVWCFCGDGCEEQGGFYEAVWFVQERQLPCTFIIEDNCSSCGVSRLERRGSNEDRPWPECVVRVKYRLKWPHSGTKERPVLKSVVPPTSSFWSQPASAAPAGA